MSVFGNWIQNIFRSKTIIIELEESGEKNETEVSARGIIHSFHNCTKNVCDYICIYYLHKYLDMDRHRYKK